MQNNQHTPVLIDKILEFLPNKIEKNNRLFEGTLGGGGYTNKFIEKVDRLYVCDLDQSAVDNFLNNLDNGNKTRVEAKQSNFSEYIKSFEDNFFDFIVLDLGYSSNQLEFSNRGFSYQKKDEVLDIRYDMSSGIPCWQKISKLKSADDLRRILYNYSGEPLAAKFATPLFEFITQNQKPSTVEEVVEIIIENIPKKFRKQTNSILSRIWQALRIYTNQEFENLESFLETSTKKLKPNGLLLIVDFHSLEDKIVTKFMRNTAKPIEIDDFGNKQSYFKILTPKGVKPEDEEIDKNPRSRSATLRVLQKLV